MFILHSSKKTNYFCLKLLNVNYKLQRKHRKYQEIPFSRHLITMF